MHFTQHIFYFQFNIVYVCVCVQYNYPPGDAEAGSR
jgi:hypothetical protein